MNKIYITWQDYHEMIMKLYYQIKLKKPLNKNFDGIYGVPRGGLTIAVCLSHLLKLPLLLYPTQNSLVVDDISDEGKTLESHKNKFIATLFSTDWTITPPNCFVNKKENKTDWIVFPWEYSK